MFVEINDKYNALVREKKHTFMLELECNCKCVTKKGSKKIITENLYQPQFFESLTCCVYIFVHQVRSFSG